MGKFKRNFKKYICLSMCMALILTTVFVGTAASVDNIKYYRSAKVWKGGDNGDTISVSDYALLDGEGNSVTGLESKFSSDYINALKNGLDAGDVKAKKTVLFATDADKANGYLKTNIDIVGNITNTNEAKDVLFVRSVSNYSAMFSEEASSYICPCLNYEHYYRIEKGFSFKSGNEEYWEVKNETGRDLFVNLQDVVGDNFFNDFSRITIGMINEYLEKTYGNKLTLQAKDVADNDFNKPKSTVVDQFWQQIVFGRVGDNRDNYLNHYAPTVESNADGSNTEISENEVIFVKNRDGTYTPQRTNMKQVANGLFKEWKKKSDRSTNGSPEVDNADGCFDRAIVSQRIVKSFAEDLVSNNQVGADNNRVALINFAGYHRASTSKHDGNGNIYLADGFGFGNMYYPVVSYADFTESIDGDFESAITSTNAYTNNDPAVAFYAATQMMTKESEIPELGNYNTGTEETATLDLDNNKGYFWAGKMGIKQKFYDGDERKYFSNTNLKKANGTRSNAEKIIVFINDSEAVTYPLNHDIYKSQSIQSSTVTNINYTEDLKSSGVTIYSAGFMVPSQENNNTQDMQKLMENAASGTTDAADKAKYYINATNAEEFRAFLNTIKGDMLKTPCKSVSDTLGNNYSFICDSEHPVSVQVGADDAHVTYSSLDDAVQSGYFKLSEDKKTIIWNGGDVSKGVRISFYSKLDDEYLFPKNASAETKEYPTNNAQTLVYTKNEETINSDVEYAGYKLSVKSGTAKVELSRVPAAAVRKGSEITYTLRLVKSGAIDLNNVTVSATAPENITLKAGSTPPDAAEINTDNPLSYTVTVNNNDNVVLESTVIENVAHFTIDKTANNIPDAVDLSIDNINTNTVKNKVSANGTIAITAPNKKLSSDKTQAYIYKVTKTGTDGNEVRVATVMVAAGKTEVVSGLVTGAYKVAEITDWAWRYKNAESTKERTVTITGDKLDIAAEFSKDSQSGGPLSGHSSKWSNKYGVDGGVSING